MRLAAYLLLALSLTGPFVTVPEAAPRSGGDLGGGRRSVPLALAEARDCARLEPPVSCVLLLGRSPESGGAARLLAVAAALSADAAARRAPAFVETAARPAETPPDLPSLGRAPPARA